MSWLAIIALAVALVWVQNQIDVNEINSQLDQNEDDSFNDFEV